MLGYKKYCYWVDVHGLGKVREDLERKEVRLTEEARIPCRALRTAVEIGFVAPSAWDGLCKRKTSWYRESGKAGKSLVVSNKPFDFDLGNPISIAESNFKPDRFPSSVEIVELIQSEEYQKRKPGEWDKVDPLEKDFYRRWFERQKKNDLFDFDKILMSHSANHANFIDPKFFIDMNGRKVPYSISDSLHVCSSCLEFFNILGDQWPIKYVVPCIGAVQFAHLPINQYFKIVTRQ